MADRVRAALVHLGICFLIAIALIFMIYGVWYPAPLAAAVGVGQIFLLVLAVDLVLGPALTFVVYKKKKKTLVMDLTLIALLQLAGLSYGVWVVAQGRPAWLVFNADRMDLVQALEVDRRFLSETPPGFRRDPWFGPRWVAAVNPQDQAKRNDLVLESAMGGADLPQRPDLYVPIESQREAIRFRLLPLVELDKYNTANAVAEALKPWSTAVGWLPLMARMQPMIVLVDAEARPLAVLNLRPWN